MAKRRGNNEGTTTQRPDGRWESKVSLPSGKRRSIYGTTYAESRKKKQAALAAVEAGLPIPGELLTVEAFLTSWLVHMRSEVRAGTWARYEQLVRIHIVPELGSVRVARLAPEQLRRLFTAKLEAGLAVATVRYMRAVLRSALAQALADGLVCRNVAAIVKAPRAKPGVSEPAARMRTLSPAQARAFLAAAAGDRLAALYQLAITTGMRRGELLALHWSDVDLKTRKVTITGTLQRTGEGLRITPTKTRESRRTIEVTQETADALRRHKATQAEERLGAGELWQDHDLVFASELGTPMEPGNLLRRSFWPLLAEVGLADRIVEVHDVIRRGKPAKRKVTKLVPHLRFHDLRHTAATLLLEKGVHPSVVAAMLGHSRTSTTLNVYSHVAPRMLEAATRAMTELFA